MELLSTRNGKPSLAFDGYQYRLHKKCQFHIRWLCLNEKKNCKGSVKTDFQYNIISKTDHVCVPNEALIQVKKIMNVCQERVKEEVSVPVHRIFRQEISKLYGSGYDLVAAIPPYENVKSSLCKNRRETLGTVQNPQKSEDIIFPEDLLILPNKESFLRLDFNDNSKRILVFAGEGFQDLLKGDDFFLDGTFKSCPKQFHQLLTIHSDLGSTSFYNQVYPALFCLLPDKREETYRSLLQELRNLSPQWNPKKIKLDFEAGLINAVKEVFPRTTVSGCSFHFSQCLWRKIQELGLTELYKNNENIRRICRMCSALSYLPPENVEDGWLIIMEDIPQNEILSSFMDYFVTQWMDNPNVSIEMWNVYGQRHRTNNIVEGFNSRLNTAIGRNQPNIFFLVNHLKEETKIVLHRIQAKDLGDHGQKRKKMYVKLDERIQNIMTEFDTSKDLKKCLTSLSYVAKLD